MNGLSKRGDKWYSLWKKDGKRTCYAIGLAVGGDGALSASACKKAAERISSIWKDVATGSITRIELFLLMLDF